MTKTQLIEEWWLEPGMGDLSMEENHQEGFWQEVLDRVIDIDLTGKKVLDFGCSRGGLLRHLYTRQPYASAVGVDVAAQSIAAAEQNKGGLPVRYFSMTDIGTLDRDFDCAISSAVIYLIQDIAGHAQQIYDRLKPGGIYFATHPDYVSDPFYEVTRAKIDEFAAIPSATNDMNTIITAFEQAGFKVHVKRTPPPDYFSVSANGSWYGTPHRQIQFLYNHRYAFRCVKPL